MNTETRPMRASGACLCGDVRYEVRGPLRPVIVCHCSQCRRSTGHVLASTAARRADFVITHGDSLRWYDSSEKARRGFCGRCGSNLFWDGKGLDYVAISAGTLDPPTGLALARHIYVASKGDYYTIDDGLPQSRDGLHTIPTAPAAGHSTRRQTSSKRKRSPPGS